MDSSTDDNVSLKQTLLIVEGSGQFPVDMLRYDSCAPWSEGDSYSIATRHDHRRVALRRFSTSSGATSARWRSFGWLVLSESPTSVDLPADLHLVVYRRVG